MMVGNGLVVTMDCATWNLPKITLLHCSLVIFTNQPQLGADDWAVIFSGLMLQLMTRMCCTATILFQNWFKRNKAEICLLRHRNHQKPIGFLWFPMDFSMDVSQQSMDFTPGGGG